MINHSFEVVSPAHPQRYPSERPHMPVVQTEGQHRVESPLVVRLVSLVEVVLDGWCSTEALKHPRRLAIRLDGRHRGSRSRLVRLAGHSRGLPRQPDVVVLLCVRRWSGSRMLRPL